MTETTIATNKTKTTKRPPLVPGLRYFEIRDAKIRPADHGNARGIS